MILVASIWLAILLFKCIFTLQIFKRPSASSPHSFSQVSVLQPILSGDPMLEATLEANLQTLIGAHFFWLIDDEDQQAARTVTNLQQRYPQSEIHIHSFAAAPEGVNPKVFKLEQARQLVESEICLILDDDATLTAEALQRLLADLTDNSLVTALPYYSRGENVSSELLAQFVNDNAALTYLPLLPFSAPLTINGMCYALYRSTLEQNGGFKPIFHYLTDDLALATYLTSRNVRLVQSTATVKVQTSVKDIPHYISQMHRWFLFATLLMREKSRKMNMAIFILQGVHPILLWAMIIMAITGGGINIAILAVCLVIRHKLLRLIQHKVAIDIPARRLISLISELLQPLHFLHALLNRTIRWRTRRYRIHSNRHFTSL